MQIKVNNIREDDFMEYGKGNLSHNTKKLVAEGKLVLINQMGEAKITHWFHNAVKGDFKHPLFYYKPILISETEKIEEGWKGWAYKKDVVGQLFSHFYTKNTWYDDAKIVLALPEHFSTEQLQMIVDGKLKDGERVLVECEFKDNWNSSIVPYTSYYEVKLSPHISLYPREEKMYTESRIYEIAQQAHQAGFFKDPPYTDDDGPDTCYLPEKFKEWFEKNIK